VGLAQRDEWLQAGPLPIAEVGFVGFAFHGRGS
jgi:hypothetical protein